MSYLLNLPLPLHNLHLRIHIQDLLRHRPVWSRFRRRGDHDRNVEEFTYGSVSADVGEEERGVPVTGYGEEANLVVDNEEGLYLR